MVRNDNLVAGEDVSTGEAELGTRIGVSAWDGEVEAADEAISAGAADRSCNGGMPADE